MQLELTKNIFFVLVTTITVTVTVLSLGINFMKDLTSRSFKEVLVLGNDTLKRCFRLASDYTDLSNNRNVVLLSDDKNITSCKTFVTIQNVHKAARTGNQMFFVAAIIGLAYKYDAIPVIPPLPLTQYFSIPYISDMKLTNDVMCWSQFGIFNNCSKEFSMSKNVTLVGYLQSFKYFCDIRNAIRQVFTFREKYIFRARKYFKTVYKQNFQHVCIHVRRTDMLSTHSGYNTADVGFFIKAMKFYTSNYSDVKFIVISDDIAWCKKNLNGTNVSFSPFTDAGDDLALMTLCNHVIVTSGTFGWWGAWLAGGTTVYFKDYIKQDSYLAREMKTKDYYPPNWIGMN